MGVKCAIFILLPITALLFYPTYIEEFEFPKALILVSFCCFAFLFVNWRYIFTDRVAGGLFFIAISAAISTLFSVDKHISIFGNIKCPCGVLVFISYLVLYLAAIKVFESKKATEQLFDILTATSITISGYAISQALGYDFMIWHGAPESYGYIRPVSFLGHPNFVAEYLAMTMPILIWRVQNNWRCIYKIFYGVASILSAAAIFLAQSRGMWIAAFVGMNLFFFLSKIKHKYIIVSYAGIFLTITTCIGLSPSFRETAKDRLENVVNLDLARTEYLKAAVRIWKRNPYFGIGTDAYELGFQHQRSDYYWRIQSAGSPHKAHNDFLNMLATQGLFGAMAAILLSIAVFFRCRQSKSEHAAPLISSIVIFYIAGLSSFTVIAVGCLFVVFLAILKADTNENSA